MMCCCNSDYNGCVSAAADSRICYCSRYVETAMRTYYGPGVTQEDLTEQTNAYLASIAATLERAYPPRRCCR